MTRWPGVMPAEPDSRGVDIIQNCEVTGIDIENGVCRGVQTSRGPIRAKQRWRCVLPGHRAGCGDGGDASADRKPCFAGLCHRRSETRSAGGHHLWRGAFLYVSQSDKGGLVFGGDIDGYNTYAQRGNLPVVEDVAEGGMAIMPIIGRARLLRSWGGIMDMSMDGTPLSTRPTFAGSLFQRWLVLRRLQGHPGSRVCYAHLLAKDTPHPVARKCGWTDSIAGHIIDEKGQGNQPNLH